jgi:type VI protein secretion system component Hcp
MDTTTQIYLQIMLERGGYIEGDTEAGGYENRIDIEDFQFTAKAGKLSLKDLENKGVRNNLDISVVSISKFFDRASLQLAGVMKRRERFTEAKIAVDQQYINPDWAGKVRNEVLILYLYQGYVADIKFRTSEANAGAQIKEDIELSFHDFRIEYYAEDRGNAGRLVQDYRWEPCIYQTSRPEQEG